MVYADSAASFSTISQKPNRDSSAALNVGPRGGTGITTVKQVKIIPKSYARDAENCLPLTAPTKENTAAIRVICKTDS